MIIWEISSRNSLRCIPSSVSKGTRECAFTFLPITMQSFFKLMKCAPPEKKSLLESPYASFWCSQVPEQKSLAIRFRSFCRKFSLSPNLLSWVAHSTSSSAWARVGLGCAFLRAFFPGISAGAAARSATEPGNLGLQLEHVGRLQDASWTRTDPRAGVPGSTARTRGTAK